ncbi:ABC transporter ATP-binding protein [Streptomyces sp. P1-3]|uniref:ABC transporter ATP-binding protein n=1 Tax=Streptomyces sp. P1-3 TaxID=3421658 RepID=UPI003D36299D
MSAVARITDLRVEVDGSPIVDGVSLAARPGTVTALVGPSGSGKTTTGLALLGEYPAGARVTGDVQVAEGPVGYVPQHPAAVLNPVRHVGALLHDIARTQVRTLPRNQRRAAARERVLRALELAQLPDGAELLRRYPHQLSGGQQQRVVIAQALLLGARVVVADEPTTGQDALTKRRIVGELASVAAQGIAVVLLSHDLAVVRELADDVVVMKDGRVVESGPAEQIWSAPRHAWTRQLLATDADPDSLPTAPATDARPAPSPTALATDARPDLSPPAPATDARPEPSLDADARPDSSPPAPATDTRPLLTVRGLTARHGSTAVLRDASLTVAAGECLAVVGRSGSGKTTFARCVAGLHRSYDGEVLLDGTVLPRSLRARGRELLAAVQYVFQDARAAFDEHRPVLDQVARTAVRLRGATPGEAAAEALRTLAETGLDPELVRRRPGELSGGELQRAALARALVAGPRVLVCDEITSGLDMVTRRGVLDLLAALLRDRRDMALVLITHDLDTAAQASRIAVLDAGEIVEQGTAAQVLTRPRHPFTASLVAAAPASPARRDHTASRSAADARSPDTSAPAPPG